MRFFLMIMCALVTATEASGADPQDPKEIKKLVLPGESFLVENRPAFLLWPEDAMKKTPQPWVFYAPTLAGYPDEHEKWMHQQFLAAGVAVAGIDVGEAYGSPASRKLFDAFLDEMTEKRGLAKKPCLLGRSRGGLWVTAWACDHPERFAGLAGIYPVFDFRTYPGVAKAAVAYEMSPAELEKQNDLHNPIARMPVLATAKLPVFIIHGDEDKVVPLKENSQTFLDTYQRNKAEDKMKLMVVKGQGHNFWEGFFRCQALVDFVVDRAKAGAEK